MQLRVEQGTKLRRQIRVQREVIQNLGNRELHSFRRFYAAKAADLDFTSDLLGRLGKLRNG